MADGRLIENSYCTTHNNVYKAGDEYKAGDLYCAKGDSLWIYLNHIASFDYSTQLLFKKDGIYVRSKAMLDKCEIRLNYSTHRCLSDCSANGLDFAYWDSAYLDFAYKDGESYVFYAPYDKFESGNINYLKSVIFMYYPEGFYSILNKGNNEIEMTPDEFAKYCDVFKAHLL